MQVRTYIRPASLTDALHTLATVEEPIAIIAGGTDVLVYAREDDRYANSALIDIYGLAEELGQIREEGDDLIIGALATHAAIAKSPLVLRYAPILADACRSIAAPQVRNHATIAGNIANASPAADSLGALAVLRAKVGVQSPEGQRELAMDQIIARPYRNNLGPRDLITYIRVPKLEGYRHMFYKLGRRRAQSISRMTLAALVKTDCQGVVADFRITVGATFPRPMVFPDVDAMLIGKKPTQADLEAVAKALSDKIPEIAGIRASTTYKQPVCQKLCLRILNDLLGGDQQ